MSPNPSLPLAILVVTLLLSSANSSTLYNFTFDSQYGNVPSYSLGYIDDGSTVTVSLTTTAKGTNAISLATAPLTVQLSPKDFTSSIQIVLCTTPSTYVANDQSVPFSCPIVSSGEYILTI